MRWRNREWQKKIFSSSENGGKTFIGVPRKVNWFYTTFLIGVVKIFLDVFEDDGAYFWRTISYLKIFSVSNQVERLGDWGFAQVPTLFGATTTLIESPGEKYVVKFQCMIFLP